MHSKAAGQVLNFGQIADDPKGPLIISLPCATEKSAIVNGEAILSLKFLFPVMLLLSACSWPIAPNTAELRKAESALTQFLTRNGYTEAGHPNGLPVQHASLWDGLSTEDELKEIRKGSLVGRPYCVLLPAEYPYTFVFKNDEIFTAVKIEADGSGWVHEANPIVNRERCHKLPSDSALE